MFGAGQNNPFGGGGSPASGTGVFASTSLTSTSLSVFGSNTTTVAAAPSAASSSNPLFGATASSRQGSALGSAVAPIFGSTNTTSFKYTAPFGEPAATGGAPSTQSVFGQGSHRPVFVNVSSFPESDGMSSSTAVFGAVPSVTQSEIKSTMPLFGQNVPATGTLSSFGAPRGTSSIASAQSTAAVSVGQSNPVTGATQIFGNSNSLSTTKSSFFDNTNQKPESTPKMFGDQVRPPSVTGGLKQPSAGPLVFGTVGQKDSSVSGVFGGNTAKQHPTVTNVFFDPEQNIPSAASTVFGSYTKPRASASSSVFSTTGTSAVGVPEQSKPSTNTVLFAGSGNLQPSAGVFGSSSTSKTLSEFGASGNSKQPSGFGGSVESKQPSAFGGSGESKQQSAFGGSGKSKQQSAFGGSDESKQPSAFGGSGKSKQPSAFGGSGESKQQSAFGGSGKSKQPIAFGGPGKSKQPSAFGGSGKSKQPSAFGGSGESKHSSAFGGSGESKQPSAFGGSGESKQSSAFGGSGESKQSSAFGSTSQATGASVFGGSSQSKVTSAFSGSGKPTVSSVFGGFGKTQKTSVFRDPRETESESEEMSGKQATSAKSLSDSEEGRGSRQRSISPVGRRPLARKPLGTDSSLFRRAIKGAASSREPSPSAPSTGELYVGASDPSPQQPPPSRRRLSQDQVAHKVAIVCRNVPDRLNNRAALKKHFGGYGTLTRVYPNLARHSATLHFQDHESAEAAKQNGKLIQPGLPPLTINWGSHNPKSERQEGHSQPVPARRRHDPIDDEIASMAGTDDISTGRVQILRRPGQGTPSPTTIPASQGEDKARGAGREQRENTDTQRTQPPAYTASKSEKVPTSSAVLKVLSGPAGVGHNSNEFYNILENRDKIIREATGKQKKIDLSTAKVLKGTCPDMCPEKERYMREYRRHLSVYEMVPGTDLPGQNPQVDHSRAVKEYSRSSADQEMPLPQECRPPAALTMTMDYLMGHIMDLGRDGHWEDWYDFLWNRTRAIRKDITQQHLCDLATVDLVEKCVRFHIYCAHRLCQEEYVIFDPKINNENLTKCLQTLKELYHDVKTQGQSCPCEAEFRAYMVLMNLNEGDTIREAQQLRMDLRDSPQLHFVLEVYSALNSDNYIKFFKLMNRASFLSACIMHRYFNQVRSQALMIMLKAYCLGGHSVSYPLSKMVQQLAFEDEEEAGEFCGHHGLSVSDYQVTLDRGSFIQPESSFTARRAINKIEIKQTGSVGDVVNGGPLKIKPIPTPSFSFDASGQYVGVTEAVAEEVRSDVLPAVIPEPLVARETGESVVVKPGEMLAPLEPPAEKSAVVYSNEVIKVIAKELFNEVIDELVRGMSYALMRAVRLFLDSAPPLCDHLLEEVTAPLLREISRECIEETAALEEARLKQERQRRHDEHMESQERASLRVSQEMIVEEVGDQCKELVVSERRLLEEELEVASIQRVTQLICTELWTEVSSNEAESISNVVYATDVLKRRRELDDASRATHLLRLRRYLHDWKKHLAGRQRLRRSMFTFPPGPPLLPPDVQLQQLLPASKGILPDHNSLHLGASSRLTLQSASQVCLTSMRLTWDVFIHLYMTRLREERAWEPLNLAPIVGRALHKSSQGRVDWKVCVSCPKDPEANTETSLTAWVCAKLKKGMLPTATSHHTELLSLYTAKLPNGYPLGFCARKVSGMLSQQQLEEEAEKRHLLGTMGVVVVIDDRCSTSSEAVGRASKRLQMLLDAKPEKPAVPVLVISYNLSESMGDKVGEMLGLSKHRLTCIVSKYKLVDIGWDIEDEEAIHQLSAGLEWLAEQCPTMPALRQEVLREVIEDQLGRHFFSPVYKNLALRRRQSVLDQPPENLCLLYNRVVSHIADGITHDQLTQWSTPIPELRPSLCEWNKASHLEQVRQMILQLSLPEPEWIEEGDWSDGQDELWHWLAAVAEDTPAPTLFSRVRWLVKKTEEDFEDTCLLGLNTKACRPLTSCNLPWTDIIVACVDYRLSQLDTTDPLHSEGELEVLYMEKHLNCFSAPSAWLHSDRNVPHIEEPGLEASLIESAKRKLEEDSQLEEMRALKSPRIARNTSLLTLTPTDPTKLKAQDAAHKLNVSLETAKQENKRYDEFLQRALDGGSSLSTSQFSSLGSPLSPLTPMSSVSPISPRLSLTPAGLYTPKTPTSFKMTAKSLSSPRAFRDDLMQNKSLVEEMDTQDLTTAEGLELLNNSLKSEQTANALFEIKLKSYLLL